MKGHTVVALTVGFLMLLPAGALSALPETPEVPVRAQTPSVEAVEAFLEAKFNTGLPKLVTDTLIDTPEVIEQEVSALLRDGPAILTRTVPPGDIVNCDAGGVTHITENWDVQGTVNWANCEVIFDGPFTVLIRGNGVLNINGASQVHDLDNDPLTRGFINAFGNTDIQGTSGTRIVIRSTLVQLLGTPATAHVEWAQFKDARGGLSTNNTNAIIEHSTFTTIDRALTILPRTGGVARPVVRNNTFVGNTIGVFVASAAAGGFQAPNPFVLNNEFQANQVGLRCAGGQGTNPAATGEFHSNNFRNHFGDAYAGFRGLASQSTFSTCRLNNNFFASGESRHDGTQDTITNPAAAAVPNSAPVSPVTPQVITNTQTLNNPTLNGPLIVDDGGTLTITGTLNANGQLWGSGTGGVLHASGIGITNNGQLTVRNTNDDADNLNFIGPAKRIILFGLGGLTMHALVWRNNATLSGWTGSNIDSLLQLSGGSHADDATWSSTLTDFNIDGSSHVAVFANLFTLTVSGGTWKNAVLRPGVAVPTSIQAVIHSQITPITVEDALVENFVAFSGHTGVVDVLGGMTINDNTFRTGNYGVVGSTGATITTDGNVYDGNLIGFLTILSASVTLTNEVYGGNNYGIYDLLAVTATSTGSTFAYNAYGVLSHQSPLTVTNGNFRDNYQFALIGVPDDQLLTGAAAPASITCTNCFFYRTDDQAWSAGGSGSTITVTTAAVANPNPNPPWLNDVVIAGPGQTRALSGTLIAPAIAREGGRLLMDETSLNGANRFPIGAKAGGNSQGTTGHLTIRNSTLSNIRFISVNSTNAEIRHNVFKNAFELFEVNTRGQDIACNQFDGVNLPINWFRQKTGEPNLVLTRNLFTNGNGIDVGLGANDGAGTTVTGNSFLNSGQGLVDRFTDSAITMSDNNLLSPTGIRDIGINPNGVPQVITATGNWWKDPSGPRIFGTFGIEYRAGAGSVVFLADSGPPNTATPEDTDNAPPPPVVDPVDAAANEPAMCMAFGITPITGTEIEQITFTDRSFAPSGASITERTWNFGDGSGDIVAPGPSIVHDFLDGGTFSVTLTVATGPVPGGDSSTAQTGTLTRSISITHVAPIAGFSQVITDEITQVDFTDTSTHPNTPQDDPPTGWTYDWDFGDSTSSALRNPSHRYADGGTYTVELTATDNDGQSDSESRSIAVPHVPPVASFTFTGTQETDTYQFTDTSTHPNAPTDSIVTRAWSCTDGFISSAANPTHRFADGGSYSCTLTVTDNDSQSSSTSQPVSVAHVAPNADFTAPTTDELHDTVFTDTSTHPNSPTDNPPAGWTYDWAFGDGGTSSARSPTHRYADGGSFPASLTVTDNDGLTSSRSRTVTVTHVAPIAGFTHSPSLPQPGDTVQFTDTSTHPHAGDTITAWSWAFGDGGTSTLQNPSHVFASAGTYDVTLTVTDDDGQSASITRQISVGAAPPVAAFHTDPADPTDLDNIHFLDDSTDADGVVVAWAWNFGDGATSSLQNPFHDYADSGTYQVRLTVTDDDGLTGTIVRDLVVRNVPPVANFTYSPILPVAGFPTSFQDTSNDPDGTVVAWAWSFGDGATSTQQNPSHTYATGGNYLVTLTVTDNHGATASVAKLVHVCQPPGGIVIGPGLNINIELCIS